jgi:hypothetical protein
MAGIYAGERGFQSGKSPVKFAHRDNVSRLIIASSVGMEKLPVNAQLLRVMDRPVDKIATHP